VVKAAQAISSEILVDRLVQTLMTLALEHAGAERGLLILLRGDTPQVAAEAHIDHKIVEVMRRQGEVAPGEMPDSMLHLVLRTRERVILDDAAAPNPFSADAYFRPQRVRSVLCLPLLKQAELIGLLYLENNLASHVFTPARIAVLELLAAQAAISLENASLYTDLLQESHERRTAEAALRRSEAYLAEAQRLSRTGSFGWNVGSGDIFWSEESFEIFGYDKAPQGNIGMVLQRVHPEDLAFTHQMIERASSTGTDFDFEHRLLMQDGAVRYVRVVGRAVRDQAGDLEFIGSVMGTTAAKRAEERLAKAQSDLAHAARVTTLGELAASLAHEINQPLTAIATSGGGLPALAGPEPAGSRCGKAGGVAHRARCAPCGRRDPQPARAGREVRTEIHEARPQRRHSGSARSYPQRFARAWRGAEYGSFRRSAAGRGG